MSCDEYGTKKINIRILFFAKSRELAGLDEVSFSLESSAITSLDLLKKLIAAYNLESIKSTIILAVNQNYCNISDEDVLSLKEGDEVAIIPPLSGG
ncbi:molybdenum cofactor synthesis 2A [Musca autumnalis]|uniref:molybdenum cofactor synthesis 2A n=1 Tax=Musca autumnalis TaxID=221902 RepID=UPI003CF8D921